MRRRASRAAAVAAALWLALAPTGAAAAGVVWRDNDAQPIAEPDADEEADYIWWDGLWSMTYYQARKVLDLGVSLRTVGSWVGVVGPREAANVNALDEVPDSTWFTNRHARRRLSPQALTRGPSRGRGPLPSGRLVILSGKAHGMTPGFVMQDEKGDRYVVKFDPPGYPEVPTAAELVCSRIVWALGWNVPEYDLFELDPARLEIAEDAWAKDAYNRKGPFTREELARILRRASREPGRPIRALASRLIEGEPKGGFRTLGLRPDDPNDTVPHEDRRELRGLRVVASWINFTDARRGNFYDSFVPDPRFAERGHLVHYLLDFSSALGSGNDDWKSPQYGHEYYFDPPKVALRVLTLGLVQPSWAHVSVTHPALGYFEAETFEPREWRTSYPNPLFDAATARDLFWGAKLVTSLTEADLEAVVRAGRYSDPRAAALLVDVLRERRRKIARAHFDSSRIAPLDDFRAAAGRLSWRDLAVEAGVADAAGSRYRHRLEGGEWRGSETPGADLPEGPGPHRLEVAVARQDGGWSPTARVTVAAAGGRPAVVAIERETR